MNAPDPNFGAKRVPDGPVSLSESNARDVILGVERNVADPRPSSYYNGVGTVEAEEPGANYRELFFKYLGLGLKHRWLIILVCCGALIGGLASNYTTTPIYRSTATIQIDPRAAKVVKVDSPDIGTEGADPRFYQTQYELLKSRSLAEQVATDLNLGVRPDFIAPPPTSAWAKLWGKLFPNKPVEIDTTNMARLKSAAASMVQGGLTVSPATSSSLVRISFSSPNPQWAQTVANGIAQTYISANLDRRYGATAYARNFLSERLEELKIKLQDSEVALVKYAEKAHILTPKGTQTASDSDLLALQEALRKVSAERSRSELLWKQANTTTGLGLPLFLNDKSIAALREKRATLSADYHEKLRVFQPDYPDMRKLKTQIDQLDRETMSMVGVIKDSLKAQYEASRAEEAQLETQIAQASTGVLESRNKNIQYQILQREADTNRALYDGLLQQYKDIGIAGAVGTNNISLIDKAELPGAPFEPRLGRTLMIWLLLGLAAAFATIAVLEILDDTFKSPEEIEEQLGLAVLGLIPKVSGDIMTELLGAQTSPVAESYRSLRTALQFSTDQGVPKSIMVTSARPGEGKSTTAVALALNLAQLGMRVLLIDADLRNPSAHKLLKRPNTAGLANYLAGIADAQGVLQATDVKGLTFMPTGPLPPNPAELLAGPKMVKLISVASENFDVVVVDAPPVLGLADAPLLASIVSGALLVLGAGETRRGVVRATLKRLHFARARMIGAVLNKYDFRAASYGYGYGYGYGGGGYGYGELDHYGYGAKAITSEKRVSTG